MSDTEWQIRNWYNFVWLCGDSLVEQAVHSVDKVAWAMNDEPPVSCVGVGGRVIPAEGGNIYDHFEVNYLYPNGVRAFTRQSADRRLLQRKLRLHPGHRRHAAPSAVARLPRIEGKTNWTWTGQKYDMYQREHDLLFAAIRKNQPMNDGKRMATSTLLAFDGPYGCLYRPADYLGSGYEFTGKDFPRDQWIGTAACRSRRAPSQASPNSYDAPCWALSYFTSSAWRLKSIFEPTVAPILEQQCLQCHGAGAHVDLSSRQRLLDQKYVTPGNPDQESRSTRAWKRVPCRREESSRPADCGDPRLDRTGRGMAFGCGAYWPLSCQAPPAAGRRDAERRVRFASGFWRTSSRSRSLQNHHSQHDCVLRHGADHQRAISRWDRTAQTG